MMQSSPFPQARLGFRSATWIGIILTFAPALRPTVIHAAPVATAELPDLVEKVLPGVVNVSSTTIENTTVYGMDEFLRFWGIPQERKHTSLGSGFVIDRDGFVLTNDHVVSTATEVEVNLWDKRKFRAKLIGKDQKTDLALLQLRNSEGRVPENLTPVPLGNSDAVRIAEGVFAVGNPFGLQHTVTLGIISAKNRTIGQGPFDNFLQTDASINPGNSGGPLFNMKGEVIGVNTMIFSRTGQSGGVGFAIPIHAARQLIPDLKRYGRVPRPWLGILGEKANTAMQRFYNLPVAEGVLIYNLVAGGPADQAGIRAGDVLVAVDGTTTLEPYDIERALAKRKPTDETTLKIRRGRRTLDIAVKLEELPRRLERLPQGII